MQNVSEEIMRCAYCLPQNGQEILLTIAKYISRGNYDLAFWELISNIK